MNKDGNSLSDLLMQRNFVDVAFCFLSFLQGFHIGENLKKTRNAFYSLFQSIFAEQKRNNLAHNLICC